MELFEVMEVVQEEIESEDLLACACLCGVSSGGGGGAPKVYN